MVRKTRWGTPHKDKRNWKEYNEQLIARGEFYIDPIFLKTWALELAEMNLKKIGKPFIYPDSLIEYLGMLKSKGYDYRSLSGILRTLSKLCGPFPVMSYSQIRRRLIALPLTFPQRTGPLETGVDGTGIKVSNRGEWIRQKWNIKRGWIKVVILGDTAGNIVDFRAGNENLDERAAGRGMLRKNRKSIESVHMDGLHDVNDTFDLCAKLKIKASIKIRKNASPKGLGNRAREVKEYQKHGYKKWANEKQYGMRWPATEGIFSAVKRIFGESVMSHKKRYMYHEAKLKFWAYQRLRDGAKM